MLRAGGEAAVEQLGLVLELLAGPPGLGSPRTMRTSMALYGPGPTLETLKLIFSPARTEMRSA